MYNTKNLISGAAEIYFSTTASDSADWTGSVSLPTPVATESMNKTLNDSDDWYAIGFTRDGVEVEYTPEFREVEVDQLLDAAAMRRTKQSVSVRTTLAEATLENLQTVWALPSDALAQFATHSTGWDGESLVEGDKEIALNEGELGDVPNERSMAFVGQAPQKPGRNTERVYHVRRVLQTEASTHSLKRAEDTVFPVTFRCMPDPNHPGAGYGVIKDRVFSGSGSRVNPAPKDPVVDDPTTPEDESVIFGETP